MRIRNSLVEIERIRSGFSDLRRNSSAINLETERSAPSLPRIHPEGSLPNVANEISFNMRFCVRC